MKLNPFFVSGLLIVMGFLVKRFPNLIAGYNTLPPEKKKNVDTEGLSKLIRNGLIFMGILNVLLYYFFKWIGLNARTGLSIPLSVIPIVIYLVISAQRFDKNKRSGKLLQYVIIGIVILGISSFVGYNIYLNSRPSPISLKNNVVTISGSYGSTFSIQQIELVYSLPRIMRRTGGATIGEIRKGNFQLENLGSCKLYLQSTVPPFIKFTTTENKYVFYNLSSKDATNRLFKNLTTTH